MRYLVLAHVRVHCVSQFQAFVKEDTKYDNLEVNMGGRVLPVGLLHSADRSAAARLDSIRPVSVR